ncbi:uncharacterized protein LOC131691871 [Topomyia yanbarensis]|uniref:uncharacterized protein LOC131691871 n=1 Tax=Topomyia yanbarensis TaxID=2498891 RepID=UPI00273AD451|nr:uncharacterized protein LOC131691871 [Topomyia yanbarensis]
MNFGVLHWSYRDFRMMPEELRKCGQEVLEVYLKENFIPAIPAWFFEEMVRLKFICLAGNLLEELPEQISLLVNLETLDVSQNEIKALPKSLGCLHNLTVLKLNQNMLTHLPQEVGQLVNLEVLDVSNNRLNEIPVELSQCVNIKELILNDNQPLVQIPQKLFTLPQLVYVSAERCDLVLLPFAVNTVSLEVLKLFNNHALTHYPLALEKFMQPNYDLLNAVELKRIRKPFYHREIICEALQTKLIFPADLTAILDRRKSGHNASTLVEICLQKCYDQSERGVIHLPTTCLPVALYQKLQHGPVAICGSIPCGKSIFTRGILGLVKRRKHARPVIFSILFCSKICADLWFQYSCDDFSELNWTLI